MHTTYLLLGSNMGDSLQQLHTATDLINGQVGKVVRCSGIYQTAAWGYTQQPDFLNQVLEVRTSLSASAILQTTLSIEAGMGRQRSTRNAPRVIDIDILFFDDAVIDEAELVVPHPRLQDRRFVLIPLAELSPTLVHPVLGENIHQLLTKCSDPLAVKKF